MAVTSLRFAVTSSWDGSGLRGAARGLAGVDRQVNRVGRSFGRGARGLRLWQKAAIVLAPAMFTLGKAALAGAGGLTAMLVAAGSAAAPWIGLAVTAAKNSDEMGKAGKAYERATSRVKRAWMDLARDTAPLTLGPMTDVLEGVATAIPKLEPLVRKVAPVFADMGRSIRGWLEGRGFERFLQNVGDYGVPAFRNLVAAGRDFLATTGIGFRHFLPLALDISEAIRRGSANLRDWAEGGGFARFLRDVKEEWPTVKRFLGEARESLGNIGQVLDDLGPGQLDLLGDVLQKVNDIDVNGWRNFLLALGALKLAGGLASLVGGLAALRGARITLTGAAALGGAAAALAGAAAALSGAATALSGAAAALSSAGGAAGIGGLLGGLLGGLARRFAGGSATFNITINPEDAATRLAAIRDRLNELNGKVANATATLNAGGFTGPANQVLTAWASVRSAAALPAVFRAVAMPGNVLGVAASLIGAWGRVRAMAALPVIFRATASPGNVVGTANIIVAAWTRVRAAAAVRPFFTATASPGNVPGVASAIVAAWGRVRAAAAIRPVFTAIVIPGPAIAGSAAIVASWMRVLAMPRSWTGSATARDGVSGPARAAAAAWSRVLSMPRSVTFTVTIRTKKVGGAEGGSAASIPPRFGYASGGSPWSKRGGRVHGPGGERSDKVPAWLSRGEWVIQARAVKYWGQHGMKWINSRGKKGKPPKKFFDKRKPDTAGRGRFQGSISAGSHARLTGMSTTAPSVAFHGNVFVASAAEFEDMVVHAVAEAQRKRRLSTGG